MFVQTPKRTHAMEDGVLWDFDEGAFFCTHLTLDRNLVPWPRVAGRTRSESNSTVESNS